MLKIRKNTSKTKSGTSEKSTTATTDHLLQHLAFDNSFQSNIISTVSNGKIIVANSAACKLLGYSKKELLTKSRSAIFDINDSNFKKMLKQRTAEGHSIALVTVIKKSGKPVPCEITSAVFKDENGIEKSITSIVNKSQSILKQKNIDSEKEKIVADNIAMAKSEQKDIDIKKEKVVADDIVLAQTKQKNIDIKNEKIVADNIILAQSKQKGIDIKKQKVVADDIALAKSEQKDIDTKKEKIVADNIILAKSKQKEIDTKKEKAVANNIILAISKQKKIDTKKEKIVADDIILAQAKSDFRLAENNEWIKYIAKTSYDVMWDWDIATGQIYVGDSVEEVFGYKIKNNAANFTDFSRRLLPEEKDTVEKKLLKALASDDKSWNDSFMFKRHDGSVASTISRANIVRDEEGKAISLIGATQDISRFQELEKQLKQQITIHEEDSEKFFLAAKLSFDVIWDWDLLTNELFMGGGVEELFGYAFKNNKGNITDWSNHIHPDDKEVVVKGLDDAIASSAARWEYAYRYIRADDSIARVFDRAIIIRNAEGKAYRMIGAMHDISKQKVLEERLEQEIKLKEKQIEEATEDAKNTERSDIGKELHDNINQLLGASKMYLEMAKHGGNNSEMYLSRSSEYTLTAIDEIRKLTKGLTSDIIKNIGLCEAIIKITRDIMEINPVKISCITKSFIESSVNYKFKLNLYRIVQEQLNNILKHAKAKAVTITLAQNKNSIILTISDNGIGFDTSIKRKGIGVDNIKSRAVSYNGNAEFVSQPGQGCVLTATFFITGLLFK